MSKAPVPILQFRAFFDPRKRGGLFVTVKIFKTVAQMRAAANADPIGGSVKGAVGLCRGWKRTIGARVCPEIGAIYLAAGYLSIAVVSHECAHAMLRYVSRKRLDLDGPSREGFVSDDEETACYALGSLCQHIYGKVLRAGIIRDFDRKPERRHT